MNERMEKPYGGKRPYVFLSFAGEDKKEVEPIVCALQERYNVWYEDSLLIGEREYDDVVDKLDGCALFLYVVTNRSLDSEECDDRIAYAKRQKKPIVNLFPDGNVLLPKTFLFLYGKYTMCELYAYGSYGEAFDELEKHFVELKESRKAVEDEPEDKVRLLREKRPLSLQAEPAPKRTDRKPERTVDPLFVDEDEAEYVRPPLSLFKSYEPWQRIVGTDETDYADIFENRLRGFGADVKLVQVEKGPQITRCHLELGGECTFAKLVSLEREMQRLFRSSRPLLIAQDEQAQDRVTVDVPNGKKGIVTIKEVFESKAYAEAKGDLVAVMGTNAVGEPLTFDLAAAPNLLVAGETGSGKSVFLNTLIASLVYRYSPTEVRLILVDLKEVEMSAYNGLPHLLFDHALSQFDEIRRMLGWLREQMVMRFSAFRERHIRYIKEYNEREEGNKMPRIVLIIDEASELMCNPNMRKVLEGALNSMARIGRAAGIHIVFATQNPVKTVITSEIQNNLSMKIAFAVSDDVHSQVIFKRKGAECLVGRGDMLIQRGPNLERAQSALIGFEEVDSMAEFVRKNSVRIGNVLSIGDIKCPDPGETDKQETEEEKFEREKWEALFLIVKSGIPSCSYLQRKMRKGYNAVANILETLAEEGYLSKEFDPGTRRRKILVTEEEFRAEWEKRFGPLDDEDDDGDDDDGE